MYRNQVISQHLERKKKLFGTKVINILTVPYWQLWFKKDKKKSLEYSKCVESPEHLQKNLVETHTLKQRRCGASWPRLDGVLFQESQSETTDSANQHRSYIHVTRSDCQEVCYPWSSNNLVHCIPVKYYHCHFSAILSMHVRCMWRGAGICVSEGPSEKLWLSGKVGSQKSDFTLQAVSLYVAFMDADLS